METFITKKATTVLIDDIDRGPVSEIVAFALGGINYEIDLSVTHANELREDFCRWTKASRRVQGRCRRGTGAQIDYVAREYNRKVRKWALERGIGVSDRGRMPSSIMEQYKRENDE